MFDHVDSFAAIELLFYGVLATLLKHKKKFYVLSSPLSLLVRVVYKFYLKKKFELGSSKEVKVSNPEATYKQLFKPCYQNNVIMEIIKQ